MGTLTAPEIREEKLSPKERAKARDSYVRNFDRQFRDWSEIGRCCHEVKQDKDWELLGFESWDQWLMDAAPCSRSYIYLAVDLYLRLSPDIPQEDLSEIGLATAKVLRQMSPGARKNPKVRAAAKKHRKVADFIKTVQAETPEQHIEGLVEKRITFTDSQWSVVEATFEKYCCMMSPSATLAEFIEFLCSEVSDWTLHADKANQGRKDDPERKVVH